MHRAAIALFLLLIACGPPKSEDDTQGEGGATSTGTGTETIGHSSTPTTSGAADGSADSGPGDPMDPVTTTAPTSTTVPADPTIMTTEPPTSTSEVTTTIGDTVPVFPEETDSSFIVSPSDLPPGDCSPWKEDCPNGQKCMPIASEGSPTWDRLACVPVVVDPAPVGAPCTAIIDATSGLDSCDKHAMCWDVDEELQGTCVAMCTGNNFDHFCTEPGTVCVMANNDVVPVCLPDCNPLLVDCAEGQVCIPVLADFACVPDASGDGGGVFDECGAGNTCDPGNVCAEAKFAEMCAPGVERCCLEVCEIGGLPCPGGQVCSQWFQGVPEHKKVGFCRDE